MTRSTSSELSSSSRYCGHACCNTPPSLTCTPSVLPATLRSKRGRGYLNFLHHHYHILLLLLLLLLTLPELAGNVWSKGTQQLQQGGQRLMVVRGDQELLLHHGRGGSNVLEEETSSLFTPPPLPSPPPPPTLSVLESTIISAIATLNTCLPSNSVVT